MVSGVAPKASKKLRPPISSTTVRRADTRIWSKKQLPRISSADSLSLRPMAMEDRGAPPLLTRAAKAETIMMRGIQTPTPVSAIAPSSGMWPM